MQCRSVILVSVAASVLMLCTSCSSNEQRHADSQSGESTSPPDIAPGAAPGVAFNYTYDFNLPDQRIAAAQEAHAGACEKLGPERCRITGMSYTIDQDEQVSAELDLKLDPSIARQFGRSAQQWIESNDGKMIRMEIGSSDEGAAIDQAAKQKADSSAQLAQLETELAKTKPGTEARTNLVTQIQALQQQVSQQMRTVEQHQAALASTPMEFHYYGHGGAPGFRGNPAREAWHTFVEVVVWLVGVMLQAIAVLLPLAVLAALFILVWRTRPMRAVRSWTKGRPEPDA